ncbi:MAG: prepilin-type N-terminal cleavage/methylation domain-containing protein [Candidatus Zixiibacteriota bacterium]|nr:MAG: prepilin-type N-terminal cleavage/methylation domain-containing protein [candidate division Zixibacteria bacterium]
MKLTYDNYKARRYKISGFTLIELLIAVLLAAIVTSAAMGIYVAQHKQLIVQDEVTDMQANIRAAAVELTSKIRMAGYKVPEGIPKLEASDTNPDTITITYDSGGFEDVIIEHAMPQPSAELRCDGHDISALHDGDWVFIYDPTADSGEFFLVTEVQVAAAHIQHNTMPLSRLYPAGSYVIMMNQFKYYIDNSNPDHPNLICWTHRTGPQVFAENITDLNFQYILANGQVVDVFLDEDMVREVVLTIDARTDKRDLEFHTEYRTRGLDTRVKVRNLGR